MCIHKWSKWSQLIPTYRGISQYRYCIYCNKVKRRGAFCANDANLKMWNTGIEMGQKLPGSIFRVKNGGGT